MPLLRRYWPLLVLLVVPLLAIGKAVFTSETIGAHDQIAQMAPWNAPKPTEPFDVLQADSVLQFYPWRSMVFEAWGKGQMPFWNPYQLCGTPLMANSQSGALYPPHILMGVLHVPTGTAIDLLAWFHLFIAGWGVYACVRRFGGTELGGLVGGISFSMSSFMLAWTALPSVISTCAWIPWVFWGISSQLRSDLGDMGELDDDQKQIRANPNQSEPTRASTVVLAFSTAMMLLAGHLQFAAYGLIGAFVLGVVLLIQGGMAKQKSIWRSAIVALLAVAAGGLLAMPQLKPVLEFSQFSHRKVDKPTEEGYQAYSASAIQPFEFATLGSAKALGDPRATQDYGVLSASQYWPPLVKRGSNLAESAVTLGVVVLALLFSVRQAHRYAGWWAILGLGAALAVGSFMGRIMYFGFPGWASTGSPGRAIVLVILGACIVAGCAWRPAKTHEKPFIASMAIATALGIGLLVWANMFSPPLREEFMNFGDSNPIVDSLSLAKVSLMTGSTLSIVALACLTALIWFVSASENGRRWGGLAIMLPIALAIANGAATIVMQSDPIPEQSEWASSLERHAFENDRWSLAVAAPAAMPPNTASIHRVYDVAGYDSLLHRETVAMLHDIVGQDSAPPANGNMMFIKPSANLEKLGNAGVSKFHRRNPETGAMETVDIPTKGRAYTEKGAAVIRNDGYDRQTVFAAGPGRLVVKDRNMGGWTATVDGNSVPVEGTLWREVRLDGPEGGHQIEFRYEPPGFKTGLGMAGIGALILGVAVLFGSSKKKLSENP